MSTSAATTKSVKTTAKVVEAAGVIGAEATGARASGTRPGRVTPPVTLCAMATTETPTGSGTGTGTGGAAGRRRRRPPDRRVGDRPGPRRVAAAGRRGPAGPAAGDRPGPTRRPTRTWSADLRSHLESACGAAPTAAPPVRPLVVTTDRLTGRSPVRPTPPDERTGDGAARSALACGALVDVLFRQLVTTGSIGDAVGGRARRARRRRAPGAAGRRGSTHWPPPSGRELRAEVDRQADGLRRRWPALDPSWLPADPGVPAGAAGRGRGRTGRPGSTWPSAARPRDEASVALVDVTSGRRRAVHRGRPALRRPGRDAAQPGAAVRGGHLLHADR